ncbi:MAG: peptidoglycan-binding protein [Rhizobiales bacterium]|nr:peptidoglycan-binding protein [Hyphomicrobiales bacterium]
MSDTMEPRMMRSASSPARPAKRRKSGLTTSRLVIAAATLGAVVIVVNAVAFQTERHPEPLFRPIAKAPAVLPLPPQRQELAQAKAVFEPKPIAGARPQSVQVQSQPVVPAPAPQQVTLRGTVQPDATEALLTEIQRELAKRGYFKGEPDGKPGPRTTQAIRDFQFAQRVAVDGKPSEPLLRDIQATKTTMKDELLDLVRNAGADGPPQRTVRDIQKALNKAGYGPLKEDGQWGPTTRQALTRFEQDNRLPMKGEPKGQNIKTLASVTGVQIAQ